MAAPIKQPADHAQAEAEFGRDRAFAPTPPGECSQLHERRGEPSDGRTDDPAGRARGQGAGHHRRDRLG